MKVTGYQLREAIKQHELRKDTAAGEFSGSLKKFPEEVKDEPVKVVERFLAAEGAIAQLQVAQMRYNLAVTVTYGSGTVTLAEAIKRVGGEGRVEKMWRTATNPKTDRYGYGDADSRDPTQIRAISTISTSEVVKLATVAGKRAGALRAAIATANAREVEIEDLTPALFE